MLPGSCNPPLPVEAATTPSGAVAEPGPARAAALSAGTPLVTRVEQVSWLLLMLLLPFSKAAIEITSAILVITWVLQRVRPSTRKDTVWLTADARPVAVALAAFFVIAGLSIVANRGPSGSADALFSKWGQYLMLLVVSADILRAPGMDRRALQALAASCAFLIVECLTQELWGKGLFMRHSIETYGRIMGPYENPIDLATFLMVAVPLLLGAVITSGRWRVPLGMLVAGLVVCLVRTDTFGPWVCALLGVGVLILRSPRLRKPLAAGTLAVVVAWLGWVAWTGQWQAIVSPAEIGKRDRIAMWSAALGMIRDRPVLGHGINTFMANYLDYWVGGERQPRYAHNCYLQMTAETGVLGGLAFLWLLWCVFRPLARATQGPLTPRRVISQSCFAALVAFAVHAAIDTDFYSLRQSALFWTWSGAALGIAWAGREEGAGPPTAA